MDARTRDLVRLRAGDACEYCRIPQEATPLIPFHVEHVTAKLLNMNAPRRVQLREEWLKEGDLS